MQLENVVICLFDLHAKDANEILNTAFDSYNVILQLKDNFSFTKNIQLPSPCLEQNSSDFAI